MTSKYKRIAWGDKGIGALGALVAIATPWSAFAAQSDVLVEQIAQGPLWVAPVMRQIASASVDRAFVAQAQTPKGSVASAFQAAPSGLSFAQAASADQISQELSSRGKPVELAFLGYGLDLGGDYLRGSGSSTMNDALGNVRQQDWRGEGNFQLAVQEGSNNRAVQQQYGARNLSILYQHGDSNIAAILQRSDQSVVTLTQTGDRNNAFITQGSAGGFATVSQNGIANIVAVRQ